MEHGNEMEIEALLMHWMLLTSIYTCPTKHIASSVIVIAAQ